MQNYGFSAAFAIHRFVTALLGRRHDVAADARAQLASCDPPPHAIDAQHIPEQGPFILVMSHYERPGLRVWWSAFLVSMVVSQRRPGLGVRWLITDRFGSYRLFGLVTVSETLMAWFLRRVARSYELLITSRWEVAPRGPMLRAAYRTLHSLGRPVAITPEAGNAPEGAISLAPAVPGAGAAIAWLSRGEVPIVPVGVYDDEEGRLTARFGPAFTLDRPLRGAASDVEAAALTERVMQAVAVLLPPDLRGAYGDGT